MWKVLQTTDADLSLTCTTGIWEAIHSPSACEGMGWGAPSKIGWDRQALHTLGAKQILAGPPAGGVTLKECCSSEPF